MGTVAAGAWVSKNSRESDLHLNSNNAREREREKEKKELQKKRSIFTSGANIMPKLPYLARRGVVAVVTHHRLARGVALRPADAGPGHHHGVA